LTRSAGAIISGDMSSKNIQAAFGVSKDSVNNLASSDQDRLKNALVDMNAGYCIEARVLKAMVYLIYTSCGNKIRVNTNDFINCESINHDLHSMLAGLSRDTSFIYSSHPTVVEYNVFLQLICCEFPFVKMLNADSHTFKGSEWSIDRDARKIKVISRLALPSIPLSRKVTFSEHDIRDFIIMYLTSMNSLSMLNGAWIKACAICAGSEISTIVINKTFGLHDLFRSAIEISRSVPTHIRDVRPEVVSKVSMILKSQSILMIQDLKTHSLNKCNDIDNTSSIAGMLKGDYKQRCILYDTYANTLFGATATAMRLFDPLYNINISDWECTNPLDNFWTMLDSRNVLSNGAVDRLVKNYILSDMKKDSVEGPIKIKAMSLLTQFGVTKLKNSRRKLGDMRGALEMVNKRTFNILERTTCDGEATVTSVSVNIENDEVDFEIDYNSFVEVELDPELVGGDYDDDDCYIEDDNIDEIGVDEDYHFNNNTVRDVTDKFDNSTFIRAMDESKPIPIFEQKNSVGVNLDYSSLNDNTRRFISAAKDIRDIVASNDNVFFSNLAVKIDNISSSKDIDKRDIDNRDIFLNDTASKIIEHIKPLVCEGDNSMEVTTSQDENWDSGGAIDKLSYTDILFNSIVSRISDGWCSSDGRIRYYCAYEPDMMHVLNLYEDNLSDMIIRWLNKCRDVTFRGDNSELDGECKMWRKMNEYGVLLEVSDFYIRSSVEVNDNDVSLSEEDRSILDFINKMNNLKSRMVRWMCNEYKRKLDLKMEMGREAQLAWLSVIKITVPLEERCSTYTTKRFYVNKEFDKIMFVCKYQHEIYLKSKYKKEDYADLIIQSAAVEKDSFDVNDKTVEQLEMLKRLDSIIDDYMGGNVTVPEEFYRKDSNLSFLSMRGMIFYYYDLSRSGAVLIPDIIELFSMILCSMMSKRNIESIDFKKLKSKFSRRVIDTKYKSKIFWNFIKSWNHNRTLAELPDDKSMLISYFNACIRKYRITSNTFENSLVKGKGEMSDETRVRILEEMQRL